MSYIIKHFDNTLYAAAQLPCVYDDFIEEARKCMTPKLRQQLRKVLNYRIERNPRYNLDAKRLKLLEKLIQKRAILLLEQ